MRQLNESIGQHGLRDGIWGFWSHDSPIAILKASFCRISLHTGIQTSHPRIVDRQG